jgi:hypothetical protein
MSECVGSGFLPARRLGGESGHSNPEGIAVWGGEIYLAGDHENLDWGYCDAAAATTPCTNTAGDQIVRVYTPVITSEALLFDSSNWDVAQTVTLQGVDDDRPDSDRTDQATPLVVSEDSDWEALNDTPQLLELYTTVTACTAQAAGRPQSPARTRPCD